MEIKIDDDYADLLDIVDCLVATAGALGTIASTLPKEQRDVVVKHSNAINQFAAVMIQRLKRRVTEEKARLNG